MISVIQNRAAIGAQIQAETGIPNSRTLCARLPHPAAARPHRSSISARTAPRSASGSRATTRLPRPARALTAAG